MMEQYDFDQAYIPQAFAATRPSEQTLQNILSFARSFQMIEVDEVQIEVYLN